MRRGGVDWSTKKEKTKLGSLELSYPLNSATQPNRSPPLWKNFATSAAKLVCRASRKGCSTWPGLEPRPISNSELWARFWSYSELFSLTKSRDICSRSWCFTSLPSSIWLHIWATGSMPLLKSFLQLAPVSVYAPVKPIALLKQFNIFRRRWGCMERWDSVANISQDVY